MLAGGQQILTSGVVGTQAGILALWEFPPDLSIEQEFVFSNFLNVRRASGLGV
jgi:hypothetical protein